MCVVLALYLYCDAVFMAYQRVVQRPYYFDLPSLLKKLIPTQIYTKYQGTAPICTTAPWHQTCTNLHQSAPLHHGTATLHQTAPLHQTCTTAPTCTTAATAPQHCICTTAPTCTKLHQTAPQHCTNLHHRRQFLERRLSYHEAACSTRSHPA